MPLKRLKDYLDENQVKYVVITHSPAYTAQEVAASAHITGQDVAKAVMVKIDGEMKMVVLPASYKIEFNHLKSATGARDVMLADESEFRDLFPDCEVGAMPPFGNLYKLDVLVAETLTEDEQIAFNGGTHRELVQMAYSDYERLVKPQVVEISTRAF